MNFKIDDLEVMFPYKHIYPEQYSYMKELKRALDANGHCLLEMPSGTGKTIALLSLIVAYKRKLIYCSRTVPEIDKALSELKRLYQYRKDDHFLGLGLSSRRNLCINDSVANANGALVDARCRNLTSSWAQQRCDFFEALSDPTIDPGVYTLDDIKDYGKQKGQCPYYLARKLVISKELSKDCIVVFDEAHNIDNVCTEALSIDITRPMLDASARSIQSLSSKVTKMKELNSEKLKNEYNKLVQGLQAARDARDNELFLSNPTLPDDIVAESIPGNIRQAEHFVGFLRRFIEYLKTRMKVMHVVAETPVSFLQHVKEVTYIEQKPLRFSSDRLSSLIRALEINDLEEYRSLQLVASFATLVATYKKGFMLILEPFENDQDAIPNPVLHFTCMDATLAIRPVFERFSSVVITSGTLSPMELYPTLLGFDPVIVSSFQMTLNRNCFLPLVVTRGSDQVEVSSKFEIRNDLAVVRNYGNILLEYSRITPDGIVCFFPSYLYMESIVSAWNDLGVLQDLLQYKLIFLETPDTAETSMALENYRAACDSGRGAILISVARGKVSEGVDFDHHFGRVVILFGIPYQYTESRILKARLEYLRDVYQIRENDFLTFDAMRHGAQCVGRVIRGKSDYGVMVFADKRFSRADKRTKLPKWILTEMNEGLLNLSTDMAISVSKQFLKTMAQPIEADTSGISLWSELDLHRHQTKDQLDMELDN